jgi:hypothetical protein
VGGAGEKGENQPVGQHVRMEWIVRDGGMNWDEGAEWAWVGGREAIKRPTVDVHVGECGSPGPEFFWWGTPDNKIIHQQQQRRHTHVAHPPKLVNTPDD